MMIASALFAACRSGLQHIILSTFWVVGCLDNTGSSSRACPVRRCIISALSECGLLDTVVVRRSRCESGVPAM